MALHRLFHLEKSTELLVATQAQLVADLNHLRQLQTSLQRTIWVIQRGMTACTESRVLLERLDGAPSVAAQSDIRIPE